MLNKVNPKNHKAVKKVIAFTIFILLLGFTQAVGQDRNSYSVQYDIGIGMGDLGDYISKASFRGFSVQFRRALKPSLHVGIDAAWNVFFEEKEYDSYTFGTRTISGKQWRYQNEIPILASVDYFFQSDKKLLPYAGLGIGTMYTERATDMNLYYVEYNPWHFALKPELGLLYNLSQGSSLKFSVRYYTGFKTEDLETQSYLTISTGFTFGK